MTNAQPIRYDDGIETEQPDEATVIDETIDTMRHTMKQTFEVLRHATAATHARGGRSRSRARRR